MTHDQFLEKLAEACNEISLAELAIDIIGETIDFLKIYKKRILNNCLKG